MDWGEDIAHNLDLVAKSLSALTTQTDQIAKSLGVIAGFLEHNDFQNLLKALSEMPGALNDLAASVPDEGVR